MVEGASSPTWQWISLEVTHFRRGRKNSDFLAVSIHLDLPVKFIKIQFCTASKSASVFVGRCKLLARWFPSLAQRRISWYQLLGSDDSAGDQRSESSEAGWTYKSSNVPRFVYLCPYDRLNANVNIVELLSISATCMRYFKRRHWKQIQRKQLYSRQLNYS